MINAEENIHSLNGNWFFIKDAGEELTISEVQKRITNKNKLEKISVPNNWQLEGLNNFNGSVWYIKIFQINDKNSDDLKILQFKGVDYFADVWLNGNYLGKHEGYFQPFYFNISDQVQIDRENILIVKVTSPFEEPGKVWPLKKKLIKGIFNHHDCRPGGWSYKRGQDQNTGGIWNDVLIHYGKKIFIENIKITSKINSSYKKALLIIKLNYLSVFKSAVKSEISIKIKSLSEKISNKKFAVIFIPGLNKKIITIEIDKPEFWWSWDIGKANLYEAVISSKDFSDQYENFGIREVKLDDEKQFYLNGKKLFLRGTNLIPAQFLNDLTKDKIKKIVSLIKEANINIVRVHAHVNRKELYDEFDRQGILVWQDFSLQWTYNESSSFIDNALSQIKDMVRLLYNHPSIVFWCCHNEPGKQINTLDYFLHQAVLSEDTERIIRTASNYEEHAYDGWYWGLKEHFAAAPMGPLVTEFGAQALPDIQSLKKFIPKEKLFPPDWDEWEYHNFQPDQTFNIAKVEMDDDLKTFVKNSQRYQADLLKTAVDFYRRKRFNGINGIFQFMFIDCWQSITWSVVDYYFKKKPGYEILKHVYQPLYISIRVNQNKYYAGKKLNIEIYLINDFHEKYENSSLVFYLDKKEFKSINNINLPENGMKFFPAESLAFSFPLRIKSGFHQMKVELKNKKDKILSNNFFEFEVVDNIKGLM